MNLLEFTPNTVEEAVNHIVETLSEEDRAYILAESPSSVHFGSGMAMRNNWKLWHPDTPIKRDAAQTYGIAHADDISSLILDWAWAKVRGESFDPKKSCERFHKHWPQYGQTSLSAGGWLEDASGPTEETTKYWAQYLNG